jgi:O-antigen/teichoic acid export membrane protein
MEDIADSKSSYKTILKATSLFASVKVVTILVNIIKNKVVALLLGTSGVGLLGIFTTTLSLINAVSDLGLSKSSVRNISAAQATQDIQKVSKTVFIFRRLLYLLSISSAILTLIFSKQLSFYSFGNYNYSWSFAWLSIAVLLNSVSIGQLAILQGMRQLKALAQASTLGAFLGLATSFPLFYLYGEQGIVPSLILSGLTAVLLSAWFLKRIKFSAVVVSKKELTIEGKDMVKLGVSMMLVSFMVALAGFILRAYINKQSGVYNVGLFQAGFTIISGYFGMIFTAMSTDYFPRLSAISADNNKIESEVNQQSIIALILLGPLVVLLLFIMPLVIELLYSYKFIEAANYVNWAIFGVVFQATGQTMGMILLAKNRSNVFVTFVLAFQLLFLLTSILFFNEYGIKGLGVAYSINMFLYMIASQFLIKILYNIKFSIKFYKISIIIIVFTILSFLGKDIQNLWLRSLIGLLLIVGSTLYSIRMLKNILEIQSIIGLFKNKLKK